MSDELETAALASVGGAAGDQRLGRHRDEEPCRNCDAPIVGRYCAVCGQLATNFHRPIGALTAEVLGDFFALDGRLMRTLPALMFRPGRVTASYLAGQRARYVPPFRLYLLSSLLFFFMVFGVAERAGWFDEREIPVARGSLDLASDAGGPRLEIITEFDSEGNPVETAEPDTSPETPAEHYEFLNEDGRVDRDELNRFLESREIAEDSFLGRSLHQLASAYENQQFFYANVQSWAPRLALLLTPVLVFVLTVLFIFKRGVFVYDHIITTLHFQSWLFLMISGLLVLGAIGVPSWLLNVIGYLSPPVYLYRMMRVTYESGRFFGILRTIVIQIVVILAMLAVLLGAFGASLADL